MANETRFGVLRTVAPDRAAELARAAQTQAQRRYSVYQQLATVGAKPKTDPANGASSSPP
jgi:pyruvate-ferredoxin/flavodoxin oxidoreductase